FAEIFVRPSAGGVVIRQLFLPVLFIPTVLGLLRHTGERAGLFDASLGAAMQAVVAILAFGSIAWYLARAVDRTDAQKTRVLEENQRLAHTAQTAVKVRDEFIGMAAHELRTPLTSLRLQMQLWQKGVSAEKGSEFSHLVQRQADRLVRLVESMLDGAALASGQMSLELQPVELAAIVRDGIERLSSQLAASGTPLEAHLEQRVEVFGDPRRLRQLVDTLLGNACKFGAGKPITVELAQPDRGVRLLGGRPGPARGSAGPGRLVHSDSGCRPAVDRQLHHVHEGASAEAVVLPGSAVDRDAGVVIGRGTAVGRPGAGGVGVGIARHLGVQHPEAHELDAGQRTEEDAVHHAAIGPVEDARRERGEGDAVRRDVDAEAAG